jgi:hypothetical protein
VPLSALFQNNSHPLSSCYHYKWLRSADGRSQ